MQNKPLKQQFRFWTTMLVVIPSILIMAIYTIDRISAAKQEKFELISQRVDFGKIFIEDWLLERARDVREISRIEAFMVLDRLRMERNLNVMQKENREFDSLSFIDREGIFQISTFASEIRFSSAVGQPYYEAAVQGKEYISDVVIGRNSGLAIVNISSPVFDRGGQFQGLILGSVRVTTLEMLLTKQWFGQTGELLLVNREGTMIVKPRFMNRLGLAYNPSNMSLDVTESALRNIRFGEDGRANWVDYLGDKVMGAYRYIPDRGWTLVGKISEAEVLAPVYNQLMIMAVSTLVLILLLLPLATLLTNSIKKPIEWLLQQAALISEGQYSDIGKETYKGKLPQELRFLCDAFSAMGKKIENSMGLLKDNLCEIRSMNSALEKEIFEREIVEKALVNLNNKLEAEVDLQTRELKQSEQDYRTLVENSPDFITRLDRNFRLTYGNAAFTKATGVTIDQIARQSRPDNGLREEEYSEWKQKIELVFETGSLLEFETNWLCTNGLRRFTVRLIPEANQYNQIETIISIARDITDQKQLETELARYDRLNVVGEMAASIGHEVRNPMTTVRGYLQYYSRKEKFSEYHENFRVMIDEIDRANSIITEFLSLAKNKTVDKARGNISNLISTIFPLLQADALCRGHNILLDAREIPDSEFGDKEIRQLILNLVRNSFEAIDHGGEVIIRAYSNDDNVMLEVEDNGPGIPVHIIDKLGTPFVTTKENGTGLGLPVCYRIVQQHGAKMEVKTGSTGTIFSIAFRCIESLA